VKRVKIRSMVYQVLFTAICVLFVCVFVFGEHGLVRHYVMNQELQAKKKQLLALQNEVDGFKQELVCWNSGLFFLEKMAREELGMGSPNEFLYLTR